MPRVAGPVRVEAVTGGARKHRGQHRAGQRQQGRWRPPPPGPGPFGELGLCLPVTEACTHMGWTVPTEIQARAIPATLSGKDVIGEAQTGTGKTGAFLLPILHELLVAGGGVRRQQSYAAVVLSPTRELAVQIWDQANALGEFLGLRTALVIGGTDMVAQAIALQKSPHIVVGTPGRFVEHVETTRGVSVRQLRFLVLDEADRLIQHGFLEAIEKLARVRPPACRVALYSATLGPGDPRAPVQRLRRLLCTPSRTVVLAATARPVDALAQWMVPVPEGEQDATCLWLLTTIAYDSAIVFCARATTVTILARTMDAAIQVEPGSTAPEPGPGTTTPSGAVVPQIIPFHGQMDQARRIRALTAFRAAQRQGARPGVLVATDAAARGLDIPTVALVINYDLPASGEGYIHRVGRTARAGATGAAYTLVTQYQVAAFQRIEREALGPLSKIKPCPQNKQAISAWLPPAHKANKAVRAEIRRRKSGTAGREGKRRRHTAASRR